MCYYIKNGRELLRFNLHFFQKILDLYTIINQLPYPVKGTPKR